MSKIQMLKGERAALSDRAVELANKVEALTDAEVAEFEGIEAKVGAISKQIDMAEKAASYAAAYAVPVEPAAATNVAAPATPKAVQTKAEKEAVLAGYLGALYQANGNVDKAASIAKSTMGDIGTQVSAALTTSSTGGGNVLIPTVLVETLIERLVPNSVIRSLNPVVLPMPNGNLKLPRIASGATASYGALDSAATVGTPGFDSINLSAKKLTCLAPVSNDLIRLAGISPNVTASVLDDIGLTMAYTQDAAFIRGAGTNNTILGISNSVANTNQLFATNISAVTDGGLIAQAVRNDLTRLIVAVRRSNVPVSVETSAFIMSAASVQFLMGLTNNLGLPVFPSLEQNGTLLGYKVAVTNNIPDSIASVTGTTNAPLTGSSGMSEVYFVDARQMVIGDTLNLSVAMSQDGTYTDPVTGSLVSMFQNDITGIRVIAEHDFALRHNLGASVLLGVQW
jgi:HK97 family phage major capsid protein